jgi:hypothetical protein
MKNNIPNKPFFKIPANGDIAGSTYTVRGLGKGFFIFMEGEIKMTEMTERVLNPTKIRVRKNEDGDLVFSRPDITGKYFDTGACKDDLCDAIHSCLHPLENLKNALDKEDDEPEPLYFLLEGMIDDAYDKIESIIHAVVSETGRIEVYRSKGCGPIRRGEVLGVSIKTAA